MSIGRLTPTWCTPRECLSSQSDITAAQIIAHNHPSGDTEPSEEDLEITKRLCEAGKLLGIELVDHVIVSRSGFTSLKEKGIVI